MGTQWKCENTRLGELPLGPRFNYCLFCSTQVRQPA